MSTPLAESDFNMSAFTDSHEAERLPLTLAARRAFGTWLGRIAWDHFVTLTFTYPPTENGAIRAFRRWTQHVGQRAARKIGWFYALERGAAGRLHFHALTTGTAMLARIAIEDTWPNGRADATPYDPSKGASYYVTKDIGFGIVAYDIAHPSKFEKRNR